MTWALKKSSHALWLMLLMGLVLGALYPSDLTAANLIPVAVNRDGTRVDLTTTSGYAGYRWVLEEDTTYHVQPGVFDPDTISVKFHMSYAPVVAQGCVGTVAQCAPEPVTPLSSVALDPNKHYFISVLPKALGSYTLGGAPIAPGQTSVSVFLNQLPMRTAQIRVFVFEDNNPINMAADLPQELGLEGFSIILEDAGGRYGASAGIKMHDAFGNPLGTTYLLDGCRNTQGTMYTTAANPVPHVYTNQTDCSSETNIVAFGPYEVDVLGTGTILTGPDGVAEIKYLTQGKYGVTVTPPTGQESQWLQTTTIEGTKVNDAWVQANEPPFFQEFGPPGPHVSCGFVRLINDTAFLTGSSTISGQIVNQHMSRPPDYTFYNGAPMEHTTPIIGLNSLAAGVGQGVFVSKTGPGGTFEIPQVPAGNYQLVVWDDALDVIIAFLGVTVNADGTCNTPSGECDLGQVPVFQWFTRTHHYVFYDDNENGYRDPGEIGIPQQNINLRWRDGTINQFAGTDLDGFVPFDEVFPFFAWQVAEVDFLRMKATGVTVTIDHGGPIPFDEPRSFDGQLNPQPQCQPGGYDPVTTLCLPGMELINPASGDNLSRTETGPVLLQAYQGFIGQLSVFEWGKKEYAPGENGGISGIVHYAVTRAENDPMFGVAEVWEPGIPNVTVNLYEDFNDDGVPDGPAIDTTTTDSWDANPPTGCQGETFMYKGIYPKDCYDGLRNFNQVRPGVFDGGWAFGTNGELPAGTYIVEVIPPAGYEVVKEEDKNVDFGDEYTLSTLALDYPCVGNPHEVSPELTLFPGIPTESAGLMRPLCDRKQVVLNDQQNAGVNFFLFTKTPIAGHIIGFILDDTANEFDPGAPNFGEKFAPPFLPISIRDYTGREIQRVYSDSYGVYNALVPSTYTAAVPQPSGMAPNMITVCLNEPLIPVYDPANPFAEPTYVPDPFFNRQYSQWCYTFQYMPGVTTYLDTPVIPVAAFAGRNQYPVDCEFADGTPMINRVTRGSLGPWLTTAAGQVLTIVSEGTLQVPNPAYNPDDPVCLTTPTALACQSTVPRDYGFGSTEGAVKIGSVNINPSLVSWTPDIITVNVPAGLSTGQLSVRRGDNQKWSVTGVTVTVVASTEPAPIQVGPTDSIQAAIDAAQANQLIVVQGIHSELVVMWKPVRLQGWGPGSTMISAIKTPASKLQDWNNKVQGLIDSGVIDILPSQEVIVGGIEPEILFTEQGSGILVLAKNNTNPVPGPTNPTPGFGLVNGRPNSRIDGFTITGADHAGGIMVNAYARNLEISNNRIVNNAGIYGGGIRLGHPYLVSDAGGALNYEDSQNDNINIHNNQITQNGGAEGIGGGISVCTGSDAYRIAENFICGNFNASDGGGIGHVGLSQGGTIVDNSILFNESFFQGSTVSGGGIAIKGGAPLGLAGLEGVSPRTGNVTIDGNLI